MKKIMLLLFFLVPIYGICGGTLVLSGIIHGFDSKIIEIKDGKKIYSIDRIKMERSQPTALTGLSAGAKLQLTVPFDAVVEVKMTR